MPARAKFADPRTLFLEACDCQSPTSIHLSTGKRGRREVDSMAPAPAPERVHFRLVPGSFHKKKKSGKRASTSRKPQHPRGNPHHRSASHRHSSCQSPSARRLSYSSTSSPRPPTPSSASRHRSPPSSASRSHQSPSAAHTSRRMSASPSTHIRFNEDGSHPGSPGDDEAPSGRNYGKFFCLFCEEAAKVDKKVIVEEIDGRAHIIKLHYLNCKHSADHRKKNGDLSMPSKPMDAAQVRMIVELIVEVVADAKLPAAFINRKTVRRLICALRPTFQQYIPDRKAITGRILDEMARDCEKIEIDAVLQKQRTFGGKPNFLSDGWQSIRKHHILGCVITLFGKIHTLPLEDPGTSHDGVALATVMNRILEKAKATFDIGSYVTDNAGNCAKSRRLLIKRHPDIIFLKCFAHDINNLVKDVLKSTFSGIAGTASAIVNYLNASSSVWLPRYQKIIKRFYGQEFSFLVLCDTRWNSVQACFASLLRVRKAMAEYSRKLKVEFALPVELFPLADEDFWSKLTEAECVIRPLSDASYRLQRDENTLADVVVSFRDIYFGFAIYDTYARELVQKVEARWSMCEQPLFLLGFFLHPGYRSHAKIAFGGNIVLATFLEDACVYYYRRYVGSNYGKIRSEFRRWHEGDKLEVICKDYEDPVPEYWRYMIGRGYPQLAELATRILSVAVNTATCERLFSALGMIHSPARNRLASEKARKLYLVGKRAREKDDDENPAKQKKRKRIISPTDRFDAGQSADDVGQEEDEEEVGSCAPDSYRFIQSVLEEIFDDLQIESDYERLHAVDQVFDPMEELPVPDTRSFSDSGFEQESKITGFRSWSMSLADLFSIETKSTYEALPSWLE